MSTPDLSLADAQNPWLALEKRAQHNPLNFSEFMEAALYDPQHGYYTSFCEKIGRDFVTAPIFSELFGQTLAKALQPVFDHTTEKNTTIYKILEIGAGNANLALQILKKLIELVDISSSPKKSNKQDNIHNIHIEYLIIEISPRLQDLQKKALSDFQKQYAKYLQTHHISFDFKIYQNIDEFVQTQTQTQTQNKNSSSHPITTLITNEWLDAIPVNLWCFSIEKNQWLSRKVAFQPSMGWHWLDMPHPIENLPPEIKQIDTQLLSSYGVDYVTESHEISIQILHELFEKIPLMQQPEQLLWLDYGHLAEQYYHPQRNQGTLLCYFEQQVHADVFKNIGQQDITAHVNFSYIIDKLEQKGWQVAAFSNQARFLLDHGILEDLAAIQKPLQAANDIMTLTKLNQGVLKLLSEAEMGEGVKVLEMLKNI